MELKFFVGNFQVVSPDQLYFNLDDDSTVRTLNRIKHALDSSVNPSAKVSCYSLYQSLLGLPQMVVTCFHKSA